MHTSSPHSAGNVEAVYRNAYQETLYANSSVWSMFLFSPCVLFVSFLSSINLSLFSVYGSESSSMGKIPVNFGAESC